MKIKLSILAASTLLTINTHAVEKKIELVTTTETEKICKKAADLMLHHKTDEAFQYLTKYWKLPQIEIDTLAHQTKMQRNPNFISRIGEPVETEFLETKYAGQSLIMHNILMKYENVALTYNCIFYKGKDKWKVDSVFWTPVTPSNFF